MKLLADIQQQDIHILGQKEKEYGDSWKKRGGVGAFMMLARKYDRIVVQVGSEDLFAAIKADIRIEGIMDDVQDLRRYIRLVLGHVTLRDIKDMIFPTGNYYFSRDNCWPELNRLWALYEEGVEKNNWNTFLIHDYLGLCELYRLLMDVEGYTNEPSIPV